MKKYPFGWLSVLNRDHQILDMSEITGETHFYPFGLKMEGEWTTTDFRYQFNGIEALGDLGLEVSTAMYRVHDPATARWWQVDSKAEAMYGWSGYNAMANNPVLHTDPNGDILPALLVGAAIGAAISGITTMATNAVTGNNLFQGIGKSLAFGAVGGAIGAGVGAGVGAAFAGTAFGQSTSLSIVKNFASNAATNALFGQDITLGSVVGSAIGGAIGGQLPQFSGVVGGSFKNALAETGHTAGWGAYTGAVSGAVSAAVDGGDVSKGVLLGARNGAIGGGVQAGINIVALGSTYIPDNSSAYGDFGGFKPVYRRGFFLAGSGSGIALGRNLATSQTFSDEYNHYLRAHETGHFSQQRNLGFGKFYGRTLKEYFLKPGFKRTYGTSGTLEFGADGYSLNQIGYYFSSSWRDYRGYPQKITHNFLNPMY